MRIKTLRGSFGGCQSKEMFMKGKPFHELDVGQPRDPRHTLFSSVRGFSCGASLFLPVVICLSLAACAQGASLFDLAKNGSPQQVQGAISKGADVLAHDKDLMTSLHYAAAHSPNPEVIRILLKAGAALEARGQHYDWGGETPLMLAAATNPNEGVIEALLDAGADISARDDAGLTPLLHAARSSANPKVISVLIARGADRGARTDAGWTVMMMAAEFNPNVNVLKALVDARVENTPNAYGVIPLMMAAENNPNVEVISYLLSLNSDANAKEMSGRTPLIYAASLTKTPTVVIALLSAGADAHVMDNSGKTALDYAKNNPSLKGTEALRRLEVASR
jgi:ankyrin repeat protein